MQPFCREPSSKEQQLKLLRYQMSSEYTLYGLWSSKDRLSIEQQQTLFVGGLAHHSHRLDNECSA
jgi:hypothetical protein